MNSKNAIIYARVSTVMQEDKESLDFQIKKCKDYCSLHNLNVIEVLQDVESGGKDNREGFLELMERIETNEFYAVVVFETSRISRVTRTLINFVHELEKNEIRFISISQPELATTTPTGMMFFQIQATLSEYERKQVSIRVKSSMYQRAKEGRWMGGTTPLGYNVINKKLVVNKEEAKIIEDIFYSYIEYNSINLVAKKYNRPFESVRWILTNPLYIGKMRYGKKKRNINTGKIVTTEDYEVYEGQQEGIIDEETFEFVQKNIELSRVKRITTRGKKVKLFTSLLECECGGRYHSTTSKSGNKNIYYYYRCTDCRKKFNAEKLESKLIELLINYTGLDELNETEEFLIEEHKKKLSYYERKQSGLSTQRTKIIQIFSKGIISEDELERQLVELEEERKVTLEEIEVVKKLINSQIKMKSKVDNVKLFKEVMSDIDLEDRIEVKKLFQLMIDKIIINKSELSNSIIIMI